MPHTQLYRELLEQSGWTKVIIDYLDPQARINAFDWLVSRAKPGSEFMIYYQYNDYGSYSGNVYHIKDKDVAMLFKLTFA